MANKIKHIGPETQYKEIVWCGYQWQLDAEAHRKFHPGHPNEYYGEDTVTQRGSDIILGLKKDPALVDHWDGKTYYSEFMRGMIRSVNEFSYGYYRLDCELPKGKYLQSAFWLSSSDSWPPEIDVFEAYSGYCGGYNQIPNRKIETNVHYGPEHKHIKGKGCSWFTVFPVTGVHTYELFWEPDIIEIRYDKKTVRRITRKDYPDIFKNIDEHPKMNVMINSGIRKEWLDNYKDFKSNPEFILKYFEYTPYIS